MKLSSFSIEPYPPCSCLLACPVSFSKNLYPFQTENESVSKNNCSFCYQFSLYTFTPFFSRAFLLTTTIRPFHRPAQIFYMTALCSISMLGEVLFKRSLRDHDLKSEFKISTRTRTGVRRSIGLVTFSLYTYITSHSLPGLNAVEMIVRVGSTVDLDRRARECRQMNPAGIESFEEQLAVHSRKSMIWMQKRKATFSICLFHRN